MFQIFFFYFQLLRQFRERIGKITISILFVSCGYDSLTDIELINCVLIFNTKKTLGNGKLGVVLF